METFSLTPQGKKEKEERLHYLLTVQQPKEFEELNFARSQGDLSENSDYDAAKEKCERTKAEINELRYTLDHCVVIDKPIDKSVVSVGGGLITAEKIDDGKIFKFYIVGASEADPIKKKISNASPVAEAILGHKAGDICEINAKIHYQLKIISIGE